MAKIGYAQRIKSRIQQLESVVASAQSELDELRIAERVLGRLGTEEEMKGPDDGQQRTSTTKDSTVADMAVSTLREIGPADTSAILAYLQKVWRGDLKQTTLASTLSRTKSEGRLTSLDGKWWIAGEKYGPPEGDPQSIGLDAQTSTADDDGSDLL